MAFIGFPPPPFGSFAGTACHDEQDPLGHWKAGIVNNRYCFTGDLIELSQCHNAPPSSELLLLSFGDNLSTPLQGKARKWEEALAPHPDRVFADYISKGISQGFRIGYRANTPRKSGQHNLLSAKDHIEVVNEYLQHEITKGRLIGPLPKSDSTPLIHCSPFGVIPKKSGSNAWRLIVDLSSPKGRSINDGIRADLASISYVSIDSAVRQILRMGQGTQMAKTDVQSAFRIIPVHPTDQWLLGMEWNGKYFIDTVLPFGLRSASKIFNAVADAIQFIAHSKGVKWSVHYLDDFLFLGEPGSDECQESLPTFQAVCACLGVPLALDKTYGPALALEFLGIIFDTSKMVLRLPDHKRSELLELIEEVRKRKSATKRELQSLAGKLQHAAKVIRPGRCFTRTLYEISTLRDNPHDRIRVSRAVKEDLAWWLAFVRQWNGTSLLWDYVGREHADVTVHSDASGSWGCEAIAGKSWLQHQWIQGRSDTLSIAVKEIIPIVMAAMVWGGAWSRKVIRFYCDNEAVVATLTSLSCKDRELWSLLRCLIFMAARYSFWFSAVHIPGHLNTLADALSRNKREVF